MAEGQDVRAPEAAASAVITVGSGGDTQVEVLSAARSPDAPQPDLGDSPGKRKRVETEEEGGRMSLLPVQRPRVAISRRRGEGRGAVEQTPRHPLWKTSLCTYFQRNTGPCVHGSACRYAHGDEELRPRPDNSWDPNSQRAKKLKSEEKLNGIAGGGEHQGGSREIGELEDTLGCSEEGATALDKCLIGLPMRWTSDNLKSFLENQGVSYKTAKKKKGMTVGFVSFSDLEQVKSAIQELNEKSIGGKQVKIAEVNCRVNEKQSSAVSDDKICFPSAECQLIQGVSVPSDVLGHVVDDGNSVSENSFTKTKSARDVVTPLANMLYSDQLEHKKNSLLQTLKRLTRNARKACPNEISLPDWILKAREIGYRNKCEFSVGYSPQGKKTVGFMLGNFREGITAVMEPVDCPNVSDISCKYALLFQEFLQSSDLPVWNRIDNTGFWRQLTVREGRNPHSAALDETGKPNIAEVMLIVQVCTLGIDDDIINGEFEKLSEALVQGASECSPPLPLTSLVVQDHRGISNAAPADCPLRLLKIPNEGKTFGSEDPGTPKARIHDYINNLRFSISPTAFFQVNTLAAEKLYSLAGDWANLCSDTLLFDVCCGTGTIGLTLAHRVGMVVGIEMNGSAVADAQRNAEINVIKNCKFVCGKAEDVMGALLKEYVDMPEDHSNVEIQEGNVMNIPCLQIVNTRVTGSQIPDETELLHSYEGSGCVIETLEQNQQNINGDTIVDKVLSKPSEEDCQVSRNPEEKEVGSTSPRQFRNVVAIVDPPRVGLHPNVIKVLRTHPRLRRLVYISCNPESMVANAIELCTPTSEKPQKGRNSSRGWRNMSSAGLARHRAKSMPNSEPFRPVKAVAVDLFPHTPHCETVMLLER
ncbi:unnamed protein product [Spirodela intermedia]|uniref:C3H1-type domain-containing protein n=1 Tax=Spirodela intermedia TaxID=51605 RepID=A0A7I8IWP9_SPIIN|nr:unnamed protein product [Spirodela intermedia]CAA6662435.1 unnamed protein product [Spirodela intermedia]